MPPEPAVPELRPFWSGTLSFGLVSIPVDLFPGQRREGVSLRMLAPDGTPLSRRYFCPEHDRELDSDEIVRGFEVEPGTFVVVSDDELDALEPEKSRDIDLRVFVPRESVPPMMADRTYFLTPAGDSNKAYRLFSQTIEKHDRAGIATFVMRGREYLVAIFAERGILVAETLRFADELRTSEDVGLPEVTEPSDVALRAARTATRKLERKTLDTSELEDSDTKRLRRWLDSDQGRTVRSAAPRAARKEVVEDEDETEVVDLMEVLKKRLAGEARTPTLKELSRDELYERARAADVAGRSRMTKAELARALTNL